MIKMNVLMKKRIGGDCSQCASMQVKEIVDTIVEKTKLINDCVLFDKDGSLQKESINFDKIFALVGDEVGYEISCNEICLNISEVRVKYLPYVAERLCFMLSKKYDGRHFVVILSLDDTHIGLRFHTYRERQQWLDDDLELYDEPILCCM